MTNSNKLLSFSDIEKSTRETDLKLHLLMDPVYGRVLVLRQDPATHDALTNWGGIKRSNDGKFYEP